MEFGDLRLPEDDDGTTMMMTTNTMGEEEIDWEQILNYDVPEEGFLDDFFDDDAPSSLEEEPPAAPATVSAVDSSSWIEEIEQLLMNDDNGDCGVNNKGWESDQQKWSSSSDGFMVLEDLLLPDSPEQQGRQPSSEPEVLQEDNSSPVSSRSRSESEVNFNATPTPPSGVDNNNHNSPSFDYEKTDAALELNDSKEDDETDGDPASKKRKRQLRNRDAAMRSRERKKMYVKDLEVKSRYLEAECRRLGRLLQCCYAENQMLRISLQSGTMAKPESAVLLLDPLQLGSLVWFMALMCLSLLPKLPLLSQDAAVPMGSVEDRNELGSAALRRKGTKVTEQWLLPFSFLRSKRCKASRTKMKSCFDHALLCVV